MTQKTGRGPGEPVAGEGWQQPGPGEAGQGWQNIRVAGPAGEASRAGIAARARRLRPVRGPGKASKAWLWPARGEAGDSEGSGWLRPAGGPAGA